MTQKTFHTVVLEVLRCTNVLHATNNKQQHSFVWFLVLFNSSNFHSHYPHNPSNKHHHGAIGKIWLLILLLFKLNHYLIWLFTKTMLEWIMFALWMMLVKPKLTLGQIIFYRCTGEILCLVSSSGGGSNAIKT